MGWERNNKNSFTGHLICPGHLARSLTYLDAQSPVIYQAKAIPLITDNTVTQMQGFFWFVCSFNSRTGAFNFYPAMTWSPLGYEGESRIGYRICFYCMPPKVRIMWSFYSFYNLENKSRGKLCPISESQQDLNPGLLSPAPCLSHLFAQGLPESPTGTDSALYFQGLGRGHTQTPEPCQEGRWHGNLSYSKGTSSPGDSKR